jgi:hypothetical protein
MHYLKQNNESVKNASFDSVQQLLTLQRAELAHAYDAMIDALDQREKLIEDRIKE